MKSINEAVARRPDDEVLKRVRALIYADQSTEASGFEEAQKKIELLATTDPERSKIQCLLDARVGHRSAAVRDCHTALSALRRKFERTLRLVRLCNRCP